MQTNAEFLAEWLEQEDRNLQTSTIFCSTFKDLNTQGIFKGFFLSTNKNQNELIVQIGDVYFIYYLTADCCSETWVSEIVNQKSILGSQLIAVENIPLHAAEKYNTQDGRCKQDSDEVYGYRFISKNGSCLFVFRNSSNGWYGGDVFFHRKCDELPDNFKRVEELDCFIGD